MDRTLTAARLARLLVRLDPDPARGAGEYERLRRALIRFFDWRGAASPDACADETLDRLARRLDDTDIGDVRGYVQGIARLVLLEQLRKPLHEPLDAATRVADASAADDAGEEMRDCFERCLAALPPADRRMAIDYYEGEGSGRIANRRRLAASHHLTENALRLRVRRTREQIEQCVRQCLKRA